MMARALVIHPLNPDLRTHFGLLHLCAGDWRRGFALYDDRGSRRALLQQLKKFNIAPWRGEPLDGNIFYSPPSKAPAMSCSLSVTSRPWLSKAPKSPSSAKKICAV